MKVTLKDGSRFEGTPEEYLEMIAGLSEDTMETNEEFPFKIEPKYFEKVKEESTEIDEGEALKVGDYAEVISKGKFLRFDYNVGDIVRLVEYDGLYIILSERLSDGLRNWVDKRDVRKIDVTEYNGKKYVEVKRKAREGELIRIVNASATFGEYGNGDVLVVKDVERIAEYGVDAEAIETFIRHEEYVVLEPIDSKETDPEKIAFQIGDKVRIIGGASHYHRVGSIGRVTGFSESSGNASVKVNGLVQYVSYEDLEKVTEPDAKGHTALITYADGTTQTLDDVKSVEITAETNTEGARYSGA